MNEKTKNIYVLTSVSPCECRKSCAEDEKAYEVDDAGIVESRCERVGCFSSVEKAEEAMKKLIASRKKDVEETQMWINYVGFRLEELKVDCPFDDYGYVSSFESSRSYDGNGELIYFSDADEECHKKFAGGDNPGKFFKKDDYAFFLYDGKLVPVLIDRLPLTKDEWKARFKPDVYGDFTDDSGIVFAAEYGRMHPLWTNMFPLSSLEHYDMPEDAKTKILKENDEYI